MNVRIGNGSEIRMENQDTRASNYRLALFDYQPLAPNVAHVARLRLDPIMYRLTMDGKLLAQGEHHVTFCRAYLALAMSGNPGVPDVWRISRLTARAAPGRSDGTAP